MKIKEKLQYIQDKYLGSYEVPNVAEMNKNERYAAMLRLSEHLKQRMNNERLCEFDDCFAAEFWIEEVDDWKLDRKSILNNKQALATLSKEQRAKVDFLRETADFICRLNTHRFYYHGRCCFKGWGRYVSLAKLVMEMKSVHNCPLTAQSALTMLRIVATVYLHSMGYYPAQDYVSFVYHYKSVDEMLKAIERIDLHIKNGYKKGMVDEEIIMNDCMIGLVIDYYKDNYVKAARNILKMVHAIKRQVVIDEESENQVINLAMKICEKYNVQIDKREIDSLYFCDEITKCLNDRISNKRMFR